MWRTSPTLVNQALPSETSTQEEGDTIHFSVKCVENYLPWNIYVEFFKFLLTSIKNGDQTQARAAGCRCDGEPTSKKHNIQVLPSSRLSILNKIRFNIDHSSKKLQNNLFPVAEVQFHIRF